MVYTILLKRTILGIIPWTRKVNNVKTHFFPNDFHNSHYLMVIKLDDTRELLDLSGYNQVDIPAVAFMNQGQQQKTVTDLDKYTEKQKEILEKNL